MYLLSETAPYNKYRGEIDRNFLTSGSWINNYIEDNNTIF